MENGPVVMEHWLTLIPKTKELPPFFITLFHPCRFATPSSSFSIRPSAFKLLHAKHRRIHDVTAVEAGGVTGGDHVFTTGALGSLTLVFTVCLAVAHIDLVYLIVQVLIG